MRGIFFRFVAASALSLLGGMATALGTPPCDPACCFNPIGPPACSKPGCDPNAADPAGLHTCPPTVLICPDGILDREAALLLDMNGNGIPDVFELGRPGTAGFIVDNIINGSFSLPGPDGFRDAGLTISDLASCNLCEDAEILNSRARSGFNTGKVIFIYFPDSDGFVNPAMPEATDDSMLYVAMDIYNGNARQLTDGVNVICLDVEDVQFGAGLCNDGVVDVDRDGCADFCGVLFDVDSDGDPFVVNRWASVPGCVEPEDLDIGKPEDYFIQLYSCPNVLPSQELSGTILGRIRVSNNGFNPLIQFSDAIDLGVIPSNWIDLFPDPRDPALGEDTVAKVAALGPRDLEFVVRHVESVFQLRFPADPPLINRLRAAQLGVQTFSDSDSDSSPEDRTSFVLGMDIPQVEVLKRVRCADVSGFDPDDPADLDPADPNWRTSVQAVPGSKVAFLIEVASTGNVPLAVDLKDLLTGSDPADVDPTSLRVFLTRPADPAQSGFVPDNVAATSKVPPLSGDFFDSFPISLNDTPVCLGVLLGIKVCPAVVMGDKVTITFMATLPEGKCTPGTPIDASNAITAIGDPDIKPMGACSSNPNSGNEVIDAAGVIDTPRELAQGFDDNVVNIDVKCRDVSLEKTVGFCTGCTTPGACLPAVFADSVDLPDGPYPLCIVYRYVVTNHSEVPESVVITDDKLCDDIAALADPAITLFSCQVCPGSPPAVLPVGGSAMRTCTVVINNNAALLKFLAFDDGKPNPCFPGPFSGPPHAGQPAPGAFGGSVDFGSGGIAPVQHPKQHVGMELHDVGLKPKSETPAGGSSLLAPATAHDSGALPPDVDISVAHGGAYLKPPKEGGFDDPFCYTNCGRATFTAVDDPLDPNVLCPGVVEVFDPATVCFRLCAIEVTKTVECIHCDPNTPPDPNCVSDPNSTEVTAVPGSCLRYTIRVRNAAAPGGAGICALEITDTLTAAAGCVAPFDPSTVKLSIDGVPCSPAALSAPFNVSGIPVIFHPAACGLGANCLDPDETLTITFDVSVPLAAVTSCELVNLVQVKCATASDSDCSAPCSDVFCDDCSPTSMCCRTATANVHVAVPRIACTKEWEVTWDSNADCIPGPAVKTGSGDPYTVDLCDVIFPALLKLKVTAQNLGEVGLSASLKDQKLIDCVNADLTDGVYFADPLDFTKVDPTAPDKLSGKVSHLICPAGGAGSSATFEALIYVASVADFRKLAICDGGSDPNVLENTATVTGKVVCNPACLPMIKVCPGPDVTSTCSARIIGPPPCVIDVRKTVVCVDPTNPSMTVGSPVDVLKVLPGARVRFLIEIDNDDPTGCVNIPRIRIDDDLLPAQFMAGTFQAMIGAEDVTACFAPNLPLLSAGACYTFGCRAGDPWLAPGETLRMQFDVLIPASGVTVINNNVAVSFFNEVCTPTGCPSSPAAACAFDSDSAQVQVLTAGVTCVKTIAADYGANGTIDKAFSPLQDVSNAVFPLALIYRIEVKNTGKVPLSNVTVCDPDLVAQAKGSGAAFKDCAFCADPANPACPVDACATLASLPVVIPGAPYDPNDPAHTVFCTVIFDSQAELDAFMASDGGSDTCHDNHVVVTAEVAPAPDLCLGGPVTVTSSCDARVCFVPCVCPPIVKAVFEVWNQNEIKFATERCINSWDNRLLSQYTEGTGLPNFFLKAFLQTDRGRARIDGVASAVVCDPNSINAPLLGLAVKHIASAPGGFDLAGAHLSGTGTQSGQVSIGSLGVGGPPQESAPGISGATHTGSLLVFPKIVVQRNGGQVVEDTFIQLSNIFAADVHVQMLYVNGDCPCNGLPINLDLTKHQPIYWSAAKGSPSLAIPAFTALAPTSDRVEGYLLVWAINNNKEEIDWDYLTGLASIVNYDRTAAWDYSPWAFRGVSGAADGATLLPPFQRLDLDGNEYELPPDRLLLEFFAPGTLLTPSGVVIVDTELTLWVAQQKLLEP
jgi:hypothetical protein